MNTTPNTPPAASTGTTLHSHQLLQGQRQIVIEHRGERYILRETSQGKLILTK
ncbi:hemin uptake protein HemP [Chitinilyticum piscinae]|uniref:Hemin uptake protein HemP n=1 Tax=Chitinilyticum piscinae TaxID=2866724 RepID=A0A8J7FNZ0_9NEIS|nr:hemin uptake protein HemP [Chitinilyticum piscinae]MBE9610920.1 hemin uptake protein HemP [Chitinilyticum piscinae]